MLLYTFMFSCMPLGLPPAAHRLRTWKSGQSTYFDLGILEPIINRWHSIIHCWWDYCMFMRSSLSPQVATAVQINMTHMGMWQMILWSRSSDKLCYLSRHYNEGWLDHNFMFFSVLSHWNRMLISLCVLISGAVVGIWWPFAIVN